MADPSFALQVALFDRLTAEVSCPIYDSVPMDAPFPYVSLDYEISSNDDPLASRRDIRLFYLSVWSDFKGQEEVKRLMAEIDAAIHERPLPLTTGRVVSIRVDRKQTNREPDGVTFMGSVTLRIITQH
ncbi:DUF3168 domain-containing protein [Pseudomonas moraviensis]|uniref:DUF3168 domain-containing protein n=1 Tax=Pseudomonas moraviensis R28-S TaxID=1395516 RepID=V8R8X6_9PSED|nr:DUF3168 domain-containing protein [Pseudomonas moraviensis]ETF08005.1 hypothetical protein PMO01_03165 [Pseudomonas moraviensis R28-S]